MSEDVALPRVVALTRYPVKSLLGEQVTRLDLDRRGVAGDRVWSLRTAEGKIGSGKDGASPPVQDCSP